MKENKKKGFSLVELLAVIVILGIIMAIAVPIVQNQIKNSKDKSFYSSVKNIVNSLKPQNFVNEEDYCIYSYKDDKENQTDLIEDMYVIVHKKDSKLLYSVFAQGGTDNKKLIDAIDFDKVKLSDDTTWKKDDESTMNLIVATYLSSISNTEVNSDGEDIDFSKLNICNQSK